MLDSLGLVSRRLGEFSKGGIVPSGHCILNEAVDPDFRLGDRGLLLAVSEVLIWVVNLAT
jgi:hypothetical protein